MTPDLPDTADLPAETRPFTLDPFRAVVRGKVHRSFDGLNRRDPSVALSLMADDVVYTFAGDHALGGTRTSREGVEQWFGRLFRLFDSEFVVLSVDVTGWPWRTTVYTRFRDHVVPRAGEPYVNDGLQVTTLRWGRATEIHTFVDTAKIARALDAMAAAGIPEAAAPPIR